jgi:glycosyltransferase involved in cell wall biosynthesis
MTTTCLISNYNYVHFIGDAIDSTLRQTVPFDEIIVVDDGSTDGSLGLVTGKYGRHPGIRIIAKDNQGQLSCFNEGFAHAKGDVVFFLDADDVFEPNYVEQALNVYDRDPDCDFIFCGYRQFGQRNVLKLKFAEDRDLGCSVILTAVLREWIGGPTSCLSMRRGVLEKFMPLPFNRDWRTRADDCLVFGASLVGARKYFIAQPLVRYRVHGDNHYCGRAADKLATYRRRLAINALFEYLERKLCYNVPRLADFHHREFRTIGKPSFRQFTQYMRINMTSGTSLLRRLTCAAEMVTHLLHSSMRPAPTTDRGASETLDHDRARPLRVFTTGDATGQMSEITGPRVHQRHAA